MKIESIDAFAEFKDGLKTEAHVNNNIDKILNI
jgi:hypothetical protein